MPREVVKQLSTWVHVCRHCWYLRVFGERITDPLLWSLNRHAITGAFGAGIAIACIPLPVHTIVAVLVALYWRVNLPVASASTWVVNPFTMVPFDHGVIRLGTLVLRGTRTISGFNSAGVGSSTDSAPSGNRSCSAAC